MIRKNTILKMFSAELERAERKFPNFPTDPIHAAAIVVEEAGELQKAALQLTYEAGISEDMLDEAVQVGAMALRFIFNFQKLKPNRTWQP